MADLARYDGHTGEELARLLGVPHVVVFDSTASTMDDAHQRAAVGASAGTVILADRQTAGRGRAGRRWASEPGRGVSFTIVERPNDPAAIDVLSLRLGIRAARVLDRFAAEPIRLKWPNDLFVGEGKVGGILVEARWRSEEIDWIAIGLGLNVVAPSGVGGAAALSPGVSRVEALAELIPAVRAGAAARGALTPAELAEFARRDLAAGRECRLPARGRVRGITASGELLVATAGGDRAFRGGSLTLEGATP